MSFLQRVSFAVAALILLAGPAHAVTFDFGETIFSNFDTLHINGVTFTANPPGFADYGEWFPFDAEFVQDAALLIDPNAGVTLEFSQPLSFLTFGAAVGDAGGDLAALTSIHVFDSDGQEVSAFVEQPQFGGLGDAERRFSYLGTNLKRAVFEYDAFGESVLAIDNLTITPVPVPEPAAWALLLVGCVLLVTRRARVLF